MAEAKNDEIVYALRFFIGFLVASAYLGTINILVSRYTPHEVGSGLASPNVHPMQRKCSPGTCELDSTLI